jgi:hypothetical protein
MIKFIELENFQSHKKTRIAFDPGVTVLTGSSNSGKTAVLRGLYWLVFNRPLGTGALVSHWAHDDKGRIKSPMSVVLSKNGIKIKRERTGDKNSYSTAFKIESGDIKRQTYEAFDKGVPEDITNVLRLTDVNIQMQFDPPFLLSLSPGDVAKYFNKIVRLDVIDSVLAKAESSRRASMSRIKDLEAEIVRIKKEKAEYDWLTDADKLISALDAADLEAEDIKKAVESLEDDIADYRTARGELKSYPDFESAKSLVESIESVKIDYESIQDLAADIGNYKDCRRNAALAETVKSARDILGELEELEAAIAKTNAAGRALHYELRSYKNEKEIVDDLISFDSKEALSLIDAVENIVVDRAAIRELERETDQYLDAEDLLAEAQKEIKRRTAELPDVCPVCGAPIIKEGAA